MKATITNNSCGCGTRQNKQKKLNANVADIFTDSVFTFRLLHLLQILPIHFSTQYTIFDASLLKIAIECLYVEKKPTENVIYWHESMK